MYAIVEISGKQFKVEKNKFIYTDKIEPKSGKKIEFNNVLFISDKGKVKIGKPTIKGSKVTGEVLSQFQDDKVIVFKKKRRKGYKVKNGHRQKMTKILIKDIK
ncbi:MAG: 50S ribosomal protein L21 [Bacteroidota bacterium]|jgi:large subunit ribosomal protein L21|nr:50S ribosomal protein L21 [Bacteroidota bacterium]|tara:strand:- start:69 stop:377 length:309 start_codon:yes stop_codon:yes gene_type:complete